MDLLEAIKERHSVRSYTDKAIEGEVLEQLRQFIDECNRQSGLHIQLCLNEPAAFSGMMARYGRFTNVRNYVALVGKKGPALDETCGYYGEKIVLFAQQLGLRTCWVAASYSKGKSAATVQPNEKLLMVISIGYGTNSGTPRKTKPAEKFYQANGNVPDWFISGVQAAMLAPTAMNQQKFHFKLAGNQVVAQPGTGFYTKVDLGIAKYHFEAGAGQEGWEWAK
ncbi:MAG: nitroreductase family protein [Christensenellaceae bacterium]|jgi:hypothetical protein